MEKNIFEVLNSTHLYYKSKRRVCKFDMQVFVIKCLQTKIQIGIPICTLCTNNTHIIHGS